MSDLLLSSSSLLYWPWLTSYFLIGIIVFIFTTKTKSLKSCLNFLLPKQHYTSRSFVDDLSVIGMYFVLLSILSLFFRVTLQIYIRDSTIDFVRPFSTNEILWRMPYALFIVVFAMSIDFGNYFSHRLMHLNSFLWQFHKVHHSATYLLPTTQNRSHPVELILKEFFMGLFSGLTFSALLFFRLIPIEYLFSAEIWLVYLVFYLTIHFRHTHIQISFGRVLSHVFSSPYMHQVHHSIEERHHNKNFAIVFSIWDWFFGSLYIPRSKEQFRIGLDDPKEQKKFLGLKNHLILPFILAFRSQKNNLK